jgi:hypothetical protein
VPGLHATYKVFCSKFHEVFILRACDFFPPQRRVVPKERASSKEGVPRRPNNRAILWQQSYAYNDPLLFVIPPAPARRGSEADLSRRAVEETAVRHSGVPDLPVDNYLPFVILRTCDFFDLSVFSALYQTCFNPLAKPSS